MPLVRCDYDPESFPEDTFTEFSDHLFTETMRIFNMGEDLISLFCNPYGPHDHSTAAAEVEWRAGEKEFIDETRSPEQMQSFFLDQLRESVESKKAELKISKGIIAALTTEPWKVAWIE